MKFAHGRFKYSFFVTCQAVRRRASCPCMHLFCVHGFNLYSIIEQSKIRNKPLGKISHWIKMALQCGHSLLLSYILVLLASCSLVFGSQDGTKWSIFNTNVKISLKNYCESWRMNVELNNLRNFNVVPAECVSYIGKYMTSTQYKVDKERAVEQALIYINSLNPAGDGKDAWIFDIDDTLLSTVPFYKHYNYGGEIVDKASIEKWMGEMKATGVEAVLPLYNELKLKGVKIFLITSRSESVRDATAQNLVKVGFMGWTDLIMRGENDNGKTSMSYKSERRAEFVKKGYRILGNVGDQWSDIIGSCAGSRTFKLPNCMYYNA